MLGSMSLSGEGGGHTRGGEDKYTGIPGLGWVYQRRGQLCLRQRCIYQDGTGHTRYNYPLGIPPLVLTSSDGRQGG